MGQNSKSEGQHFLKSHDWSEGHSFVQLEVTRILTGASLTLGMHVLTGRQSGPRLGIIGTVHGDESLSPMAMRTLLQNLDTRSLSGRVAVIPVANPLSLASFSRQTPELHGNTDLHTCFPGHRKGNLTQAMAATITEHLLDHVDALIDFHSGGTGGRLQSRVDFNEKSSAVVGDESLRLCRAFGVKFIHVNNLSGTASHYVNSLGFPTVNPEIGGAYLGPTATNNYLEQAVSGIKGVMVALGMLPEEASVHVPRQLLFGLKSRFEVNPTTGGFLQSFFEKPDDLGRRITKGTKLGEVIDVHTFEVTEELIAPVDSFLFFSRYSGIVEAGTKAFALAEEKTSQWLE